MSSNVLFVRDLFIDYKDIYLSQYYNIIFDTLL